MFVELLVAIRAAAGFLLVMFIPGYALSWAFFADDSEIDVLERLAISIGLSISSVVLTVYASNVLFDLKINLLNSLLVIFAITALGSYVGLKRRNGLRDLKNAEPKDTSKVKKSSKKAAIS